jgi:energy-coupling factor transport system permease protein
MKNLLKLLLLAAYTVAVFFAADFRAAGVFALFNVFMMTRARLSLKNALMYLRGIAPFIILASLINFIADGWREAAQVALRLVLVCNGTQIFRRMVNSTQLANAVETLCRPLKIFKADPRDIGLMVCICLAFIPVLRRDFDQVACGLRAKAMPLKARNMKYILKPFLYGIFRRADEISSALNAKAYY